MVLRWPLFLLVSCLYLTSARAQRYNPVVDVIHYSFGLTVSDSNDIIRGDATITLAFKERADSFFLDLAGVDKAGKGMKVLSVKEKGSPVKFRQDPEHLIIYAGGQGHAGGKGYAGDAGQHSFIIRYQGVPADGLIISKNKYGHRGFFGDNWPNRAHNWLPCVDDPSDKATVDFTITAPAHYTVVANGALVMEKPLPGGRKTTVWKESAPLAPKVMVVGIADFAVNHAGDVDNVPVYSYVYPEDSAAGFRSYANAIDILVFYIKNIAPYPFEKCGNVQSKTRFGGLENASAIFYYENSVTSPGVESLMAHEIAHQWFGDAVTETAWRHLWLSEGFATYMTHCYLESRYGADTLKRGMEKDKAAVFAFEKKRLTPVVDSTVKDDYMTLLNPNSYQKGSWVLHMLRRTLGDNRFWAVLYTYYHTYRNGNASTEDFEKIAEEVSGMDLHTFFHQWLYTPGHPSVRLEWHYDDANNALFITTTQLQSTPFEFHLKLSIDGQPYTVLLTAKTNSFRIPLIAEPVTIIPDPDEDVMAEFILPGDAQATK
ncbi:MAG TPA: M1 family metallopeptidase [Puia sp.]|jgi:aminopeptidase N